MRQKTFLALGLATLLAAGGAGYIAYKQQTSVQTGQPFSPIMFPGLGARINDVAKITIANAKNPSGLTIFREAEDRWVLKEKNNYPVQPDMVKKTVVALSELRTLEPRTDNPELHNRIGLDPIDKPNSEAVQIKLDDSQDASLAALLVGKAPRPEAGTSPRTSQVYVRRPDETRAWLAEGNLEISADPQRWLDRNMFKVVRDRLMSVETRQANGELLTISRANGNTENYQTTGLPNGAKLKTPNANGMMAGLEVLLFDDVAKASDATMSEPIIATIRTFDGLVVTVTTSMRDGKAWSTFQATFDEAQADKQNVPEKDSGALLAKTAVREEVDQINKRMGGWIFQIPDYRAENFIRKSEDMVQKDPS